MTNKFDQIDDGGDDRENQIDNSFTNESYVAHENDESSNKNNIFDHNNNNGNSSKINDTVNVDMITLPNETNNVSIAWRNLRYSTRNRFQFFGEPKVILRRLNGHLKYNSLNGFMGPSGAGKTTLLNCLNGNIRHGFSDDSEIYINPCEGRSPVIGCISQHVHETVFGRLTISEVLRYAFRFKNKWSDRFKMEKHINLTIDELLLDRNVLTRRFDQCSGGEQKRLAIAQELMSLKHPSFLFVDEPTTGLDSNAAYIVMKCLRQLANNHRMTIVVPIHLPNEETLQLLDTLYILAKGGVCIYSGSPAALKNNLLTELNMRVNQEKPPIEEYMRIACNGITDSNVKTLSIHTLEQTHNETLAHVSGLEFLPSGMPLHRKQFKFGDLFLQIIRLFRITFIINYPIFLGLLALYAYYFPIVSTVFSRDMVYRRSCHSFDENYWNTTCQTDLEDTRAMESCLTYQSITTLFLASCSMGLAAILFVPYIEVFKNEHLNRWYSLSAFYWSFNVIQLLESILFTTITTVLIYLAMDYAHLDAGRINWWRFGNFWFMYWLMFVYMQSFGQLLSVVIEKNIQVLLVASQMIITVLSLFNSIFVNLDHLGNPIALKLSELIATRFLQHGIVYAFYGIDRCDPEKEFSMAIHKHQVNVENIYWNLLVVVFNTLGIRLLTFITMYLKFSSHFKVSNLKKNDKLNPIEIDFKEIKIDKKLLRENSQKQIYDERHKDFKEIQFREFVQDKVHIAWKSLTLFGYSSFLEARPIVNINEDNLILRNLNGQFRFGTMNALMGTSGSGKTSLLKVLNGRLKTRLSSTTQFYLSKYTPTRICFLTQEISGHLLTGLTAKQSLVYSSRLKNIHEPQKINHEKIAINLLAELDISDIAETMVQHCSGGERKRLALALELTSLRMPNLICIDEPTSGLDSNSAEVVIDCLRRFVHRHHLTIIASIHQPNTEVMMMFDQLYMLARGGVCIYNGPPTKIRKTLAKIPQICCDELSFPVEELIKFSCLDHRSAVVQNLVQISNQTHIDLDFHIENDTIPVKDGILLNRTRFSLASSFILLLRNWVYFRNYLWMESLFFFIVYISHGFLLRFLFNPTIAYPSGCVNLQDDFNSTCGISQKKMDEQNDLVTNNLYSVFINQFFQLVVLVHSAFSFTRESVYFFNEHRNGWYSTGSFYLNKSLYEIIPIIPIILIYVYIIDFFEPIRPGIFWWIFFLTFLTTLTVQGLSHFLSLVTMGNVTILIVLSFTVYYTSILLSNLFNPIGQMHYIYQIASNLSIHRFVGEAIIILQYGFGRCQPKQIASILYKMMIPNDEYFYYCVRMIVFQAVLFRTSTLILLIIRSNQIDNRRVRGERIVEYHRTLRPSNALIPGLSSHQEFRLKQIKI